MRLDGLNVSIRRRWPMRADVVEKSRGLEIAPIAGDAVFIDCRRDGRSIELWMSGDVDEGLVLAALRSERPLNAQLSVAGEDKDGD